MEVYVEAVTALKKKKKKKKSEVVHYLLSTLVSSLSLNHYADDTQLLNFSSVFIHLI